MLTPVSPDHTIENTMTAEPLITTIIPTYRRPRLLRRAIRSALDQSFRRVLVCVYDNASGDETSAVVADIARDDPRVRYYVHSRNIGAGLNFQFGHERVKTPFFSFLSDDDLLLPGFYESAMDALAGNPEAGFFAGSVLSMSDLGRVLHVPLEGWDREGWFTPHDGFLKTLGPSHPIWTGIVFRTASAREAGELDLGCGAPMDLEFVSRVASRFPFIISKKPCAIYVNHSGSSSKLPRVADMWPGWHRMIAKIRNSPDLSVESKRQAIRVLSYELIRCMEWISFHNMLSARHWASRKACVVMRKMDRPGRAALFGGINKLAQRTPSLIGVLELIERARRGALESVFPHRRNLNAKFGKYSKYLNQ